MSHPGRCIRAGEDLYDRHVNHGGLLDGLVALLVFGEAGEERLLLLVPPDPAPHMERLPLHGYDGHLPQDLHGDEDPRISDDHGPGACMAAVVVWGEGGVERDAQHSGNVPAQGDEGGQAVQAVQGVEQVGPLGLGRILPAGAVAREVAEPAAVPGLYVSI